MAKLIQYDNFRTNVEGVVGPHGAEMVVLTFTDHDDGTVHQFTYPKKAAAQIGAALQGNAVQTAPASALEELRRSVPEPGANGKT